MYDKRAYHVYPRFNAVNGHTGFCDEPQAIVNVCLTCPYPSCRPGNCQRYKIAKLRLKFGVFPLVDSEPVAPIKPLPKCKQCYFGRDKEVCPLVRGTCVKEDCDYEGR